MEVTAKCPKCHSWQVFTPPQEACAQCGQPLLEFRTEAFDQCPVCGAAHLYRQKDFNRKLGVGLVVIGVLLAYWTYGISLLVVTIIDWLLIRRVSEVGCCYQCGAQFRGTPVVGKMEPFNLSLHDYYRNLKSRD